VKIIFVAGLCEICGGYLVWLWLREQKPSWFSAIGGIILFLYGVVATLQPANFGRKNAAYVIVFILMATLWGWKVDGFVPDMYDIIGVLIALIGMGIIMYAPRH
jgi:small multidrug resistance family-3 protein